MAADARAVVVVAGEDHAHRVLAMRLLDLVLLERGAPTGWPDEEQLDQARVWAGPEGADDRERFYRTNGLYDDFTRRCPQLRPTLRIGDQPAGHAGWFVDLYRLFASQEPAPDALIGVADSQNDAGHLDEARRAATYIRQVLTPKVAFAFGVPHCDAEGWFVAALTDGDAPGRQAAKAELEFDPLEEPHRLTAQPNNAIRDAKRVLRFLLGRGGKTLQATKTGALSCEEYEALADWTVSDLPRFTTYAGCGLAEFLSELRTHVAPRVIPGPPPEATR